MLIKIFKNSVQKFDFESQKKSKASKDKMEKIVWMKLWIIKSRDFMVKIKLCLMI